MGRIEAQSRPRTIVAMVRYGRSITPGSNDSMGRYDEFTIKSNGSVHGIPGVEKSLGLKDDESILNLGMQQSPVLTVIGLGCHILHGIGIGNGSGGRFVQNDITALHPAGLGEAKTNPTGGLGGDSEPNFRRITVNGPVNGNSLALDGTGEVCGVIKLGFSATCQPRHIRRIDVGGKVLSWRNGGCCCCCRRAGSEEQMLHHGTVTMVCNLKGTLWNAFSSSCWQKQSC
mmetsp:Transcript_19839/g.32823  ORF Transcript_19839/g.32823 Transcript_19839/m.32823 type:complete len:229 (-) Transcript_19839:177-863(-)